MAIWFGNPNACVENLAIHAVRLEQRRILFYVFAVRWKMNDVITQDSSLAARSLPFLLASKMDVIAFRDPNSNALFVKYDREVRKGGVWLR